MTSPRNWTPAEVVADTALAIAVFRAERLDEPSDLYSSFFDAFAPIFHEMIDTLPAIQAEPFDPTKIAALAAAKGTALEAFRYLAAPPLSEDDLKTLAEAKLSAKALNSDTEAARRVRDTVLQVIDSHRFPWVKEQRAPTDAERGAAVVASATAMAVQKVQTARRGEAKTLEVRVREALTDLSFDKVPARTIKLLSNAPKPGQFCSESLLGPTRADLVVGLRDGRVLGLECKVSNSAVNSYKRLVREAGGKATDWLRDLGAAQVVPGAVIGGVFNADNVIAAQAKGLAIFWSHRLEDLTEFINLAV